MTVRTGRAAFVVPGSIHTRTGGYEYDRRIIAGLRDRGWSIDVLELGGRFPGPSPAELDAADRGLRSVPDDSIAIVDGLAFGAMPDVAARHAQRLRFVALVHLPLAAEIGLDRVEARRLEETERRALAAAAQIVVTGSNTAHTLASYGVSSDRIVIVEPGSDRVSLARGSNDPTRVHLASVAAITPGKGHEILLRALSDVPHQNWWLTCAGSLERHPATVRRLRALIEQLGLESVRLVGELDAPALANLYDASDVFVLATLHESYGMAVAEALARGLAVVSTTTGAIPDLVGPPEERAGLLVPPGDSAALAAALTRVIDDAPLRARFAERARAVRERLPTWHDTVARFAAILDRVRIDERVAR